MWQDWWTWIGVGVAVLLALVGVGLIVSTSPRGAREQTSRPSRDSFRSEEPPPPPKRAAIVVNPTKVSDLDAVSRTLAELSAAAGWAAPLIIETTAHDPGFGQTRASLAEKVDLVCALGGDGTVRAVGQELIGTGVPLGLLPGGTGNLLARNLELPVDDVAAAYRVALTGRNRHIDAAWLTLDPDDMTAGIDEHVGEAATAGRERHAFFVMAGLGLDAAIMEDTSETLKKTMGWTAYVPAGLKNSLGRRFKVEMTVDTGAPITSRARTVVIGNCGKITGGIDLMPDAEPDDGTLDVIVLAPRGIAAWASVAARLVSKSQRETPNLKRYRCERVEVRVTEPQRVQVDGDIIGEASHIVAQVQRAVLIVRTPKGRRPAAS